jgi:hypothetical protein
MILKKIDSYPLYETTYKNIIDKVEKKTGLINVLLESTNGDKYNFTYKNNKDLTDYLLNNEFVDSEELKKLNINTIQKEI